MPRGRKKVSEPVDYNAKIEALNADIESAKALIKAKKAELKKTEKEKKLYEIRKAEEESAERTGVLLEAIMNSKKSVEEVVEFLKK